MSEVKPFYACKLSGIGAVALNAVPFHVVLASDYDAVAAERDEAVRIANTVLSSLRWTGDGYEWTGGRFDYRMSPSEAVSATENEWKRLQAERDRLREEVVRLKANEQRTIAASVTEGDGKYASVAEMQTALLRERVGKLEAALKWWFEPDHPIGSLAEKKHKFDEIARAALGGEGRR